MKSLSPRTTQIIGFVGLVANCVFWMFTNRVEPLFAIPFGTLLTGGMFADTVKQFRGGDGGKDQ